MFLIVYASKCSVYKNSDIVCIVRFLVALPDS